MARDLRIAVEGCGHGTLNSIYKSISKSCELKGWDGVDLLIIGGDFQAVRNTSDLNAMAVPVKYREIGDFHEYYSGTLTAPYLTIFIGGNHEASNHMRELYFGGWAAPNIYYLGAANIIRLGPLRIAGMSGIWKGYDYRKPHFERLPYNGDDVRSAFHTRELDVRKLLQGIEWLGDHQQLFNKKSFFKDDAMAGKLGSPAARYVLDHLRPPYWFSAHLHVKFPALVQHEPVKENTVSESNGHGPALTSTVDEALRAQLPDSFKAPPTELPDPPTNIPGTTTRFLALDKCLPNRDFLQLLEIPSTKEDALPETGKIRLSYDPEWLAITKVFADHIRTDDPNAQTPRCQSKAHYRPLIEEAEQWITANIVEAGKLAIPNNFTLTAPVFDPSETPAGRVDTVGPNLAREETRGRGAVRIETQPMPPQHREQRILAAAHQRIVLPLVHARAHPALGLAQAHNLIHLVGGVVAEAKVRELAGAEGLVDGGEGLAERRRAVRVVQVDGVDARDVERREALGHAGRDLGRRVHARHERAHLGVQQRPVGEVGLAEQRLAAAACAGRVAARRVDGCVPVGAEGAEEGLCGGGCCVFGLGVGLVADVGRA
ncbi:hypothetical protein FH972_022488 [Carpinus fangiana]|uniref:Lariat debranching enzyme C-terminal domain-containing protein n=1 Tax=Carpinus fangiana TaxID=176857 RepID=A0A5N6KSY3_9ROSI|nr:hypothetical protein FH972_022488 [Carpinus fangiana]